MNRKTRTLGCLLAAAALAAPLFAETVRNHFDSDSLGRPPGFFDFVVVGAAAPARWMVLSDPNPPSPPFRVAQVDTERPAGSLAVAVRRTYAFQDGTVSTYVKRSGSKAGFVLRMAGEKDFLLFLVDTQSGEVVLSSNRGGKATELGRGKAVFDRDWEKFVVVAAGPSLTVRYRDQKLFEAKDPAPVEGRAGLATEGPGEASFDEFVLEFTPRP